MQVMVVYSPAPRQVIERQLSLVPGATVLDALRASGLLERFPDIDPQVHGLGIWGRRTTSAQPLREGDRVEVYRPLKADPKVARRERFQKQGARTTGLFAKRRPGSKPGY